MNFIYLVSSFSSFSISTHHVYNDYHLVTAKEIYRALKRNEHQSERMVVFFREIEDIDTMDPTIKKKFIDSNNEAQNLFDQTKTDIRSALSQQNIYTYSVCPRVSSCIDEPLLLMSFFR